MLLSVAKILAFSLLATSVSAHGKIAVATGDQGGNGTALGILGGVVPGSGPNGQTEVDTTEFKGDSAQGCGKTEAVSLHALTLAQLCR